MRFSVALLALALGAPATAQVAAPATSAPPITTAWLHQGSDIPADPDWRTGTLANGVRYAIRRNATPPHTVAIRVRIDAGGLMETDQQQGWAHLMEHMAFRGTPARKDGEAVKLWQRLGAGFGTDTNAATTLGATTYRLDLPRTDAASLGEAIDTLGDMMQHASVEPALLETERKVVLAERALRVTPLSRKVQDVSRPLLQSGLLAARRDVIGSEETLAAASADALRAFYHRWYRPERAVVVIAGDADPALVEAMIRKSFGGWKGAGAPPGEPAYGAPAVPPLPARAVSDPLLPASVQVVWTTPHDGTPETIQRQRDSFLDTVAIRLLAQRLSNEALKGGPLLQAGLGRAEARHGADQLYLTISPRGNTWRAALEQAYGVVNRTIASPPPPAEIAQQVAALGEALRRAVTTSATWSSATWADAYVGDVDEGDVAATREFYTTLFDGERASITPEAVQAKLRTLFAPEPKLLLLTAAPVGGDTVALAGLEGARKAAGGETAALRDVSLDELGPLGAPGKVVATSRIDDLGIERLRFANGVTLTMKKTRYARDSVQVEVRIGRGLLARAPGDRGPTWSASVLTASGLGPFTAPEVSRVAAGRQIGFGIGTGNDALTLVASTSMRDLTDALRVMRAEVTAPRFDPVALGRLTDGYGASYRALRGQPSSVFSAFGTTALYGNDLRFQGTPEPREVAALTPTALAAYWRDQLGAGPVKVGVVGDFDRDAVVAAVAATFGALPARPPAAIVSATVPPLPAEPLTLYHVGDADQAMAVRAWRTQGALVDLPAARALSVAGALIQTRLTEEFREMDGGSYSPSVGVSEARGFPDFGEMVAGAQLRPARIADFDAALARIIADLATNGPSADALQRARETVVGSAERTLASNAYWLSAVGRNLDDPRELTGIRTYVNGRRAVNAAMVRTAVKRWLADARPFRIDVLPKPAGSK